MQFHKLLGQCQPEASPFFLVRIVAPDLAKFLEDRCLVLLSDPDASVSYGNLHRAVGLVGSKLDPSPLRCELHRIGKEIEKNLFDLALVADEIAKTLVYGEVQCYSMADGALAHERPGIF